MNKPFPLKSEPNQARVDDEESKKVSKSDPKSNPHHPGGNPEANLKSISHRCHLFEVTFVWELTKETIVLPLGWLQGGPAYHTAANLSHATLVGVHQAHATVP